MKAKDFLGSMLALWVLSAIILIVLYPVLLAGQVGLWVVLQIALFIIWLVAMMEHKKLEEWLNDE